MALLDLKQRWSHYELPGGASVEWDVEEDPDLASEPLLQLDMYVREDEKCFYCYAHHLYKTS